MKKNEKIFVLVLVVIAIIAIIFAVNRNNGDSEQEQQPAQQQQTQTQTNTEQQDTTTNTTNETGKYEQNLGNGVSLNTSSKLSTTKTFDGYEISGIQLGKTGNTTTLVATIKNTTNSAKPFQMLKITLLDENGKKIQTLSCAVQDLAAGESAQLSTSASSNYVNAYDFSISK